MKSTNYIVLTFFIIILLLVIIRYQYENMINIPPLDSPPKWKTDPKCKYSMLKIYKEILKKYNIPKGEKRDWVIYFPCSYTNNKKELKRLHLSGKYQRIFVVSNANEISSKSHLWKNLVKKYGRERAKTMAPTSYILYDKNDLELLKKEYNQEQLYILKKNIQRQEGIKITNNLNEMLNGYNNSYVVSQILLQDPYLIHGRKINMRFYVLFVCQDNEINVYVHDNGFMYYTRMPFKQGVIDEGPNITTGYIERWIYKINPLTHKDFQKYLDDPNRRLTIPEQKIINSYSTKDGFHIKLSEVVFDKIYSLIAETCQAFDGVMCQGSKFENNITFQLFGVDIALNNKLHPQIIEFNLGPNLATFDDQDKEIKYNVVEDIFKIMKVIPGEHNYIRLI